MKTDIQIARECELLPIGEIATQLGIAPEEIEPYGRYMAKVPVSLIDEKKVKKSRLILVTAISPTKAGIGKTTVSIGLTLGLNKIGKKAPSENRRWAPASVSRAVLLVAVMPRCCRWRKSICTLRATSMR